MSDDVGTFSFVPECCQSGGFEHESVKGEICQQNNRVMDC